MTGRNVGDAWTPLQINTALALWREGKSYAEIAAYLHTQDIRPGVTSKAVAGVISRNRLPGERQKPVERPKKVKVPKPVEMREGAQAHRQRELASYLGNHGQRPVTLPQFSWNKKS